MKTETIYRRISREAHKKDCPFYYSGTFHNGYVYVSDRDRLFKMKTEHLPKNVYKSATTDALERILNTNYDCKARNLLPLPSIDELKSIINQKELKRENRYKMKIGRKYIDIFYLLDALEAIQNPICKEAMSYLRIENEDNEVCIIKE